MGAVLTGRGFFDTIALPKDTECIGGIGVAAIISREKGKKMKSKALKYTPELPSKMYLFFTGYDDSKSAPSFSKFARRIGTTLAALEGFRQHKRFDAAWVECNEIRRDYLIDKALTKSFDPAFTRHLLSDEEVPSELEEGIHIRITVED